MTNNSLIFYDFIEIGTSDFDCLYLSCDANAVGISIEPIGYYIDKLTPEKKNVKKIQCAIFAEKHTDKEKIFYIPEEKIQELKIPIWHKGCNKMGSFHPIHIKEDLCEHVVSEYCEIKTFSEIIKENDVGKVDFIKIDTEGQDCEIVESILEFYEEQKPDSPYQKPNRIQFETNDHLKKKRVDEIVKKFEKAGYETLYRGWDTILQIKRDEKRAYYQRTEEK
jgi:hypothetical protein